MPRPRTGTRRRRVGRASLPASCDAWLTKALRSRPVRRPQHDVGQRGPWSASPARSCRRCIQNLHDLLGRLQLIPSSGRWVLQHRSSDPRKGPQPRTAARQTTSCRADPMTVSGQFSPPAGSSWPPPDSFSWPPTTALNGNAATPWATRSAMQQPWSCIRALRSTAWARKRSVVRRGRGVNRRRSSRVIVLLPLKGSHRVLLPRYG